MCGEELVGSWLSMLLARYSALTSSDGDDGELFVRRHSATVAQDMSWSRR